MLFAAYTEDLKFFAANAAPGSYFDGLGAVAFDLSNPYVVVGLLFGGLLPFLFGGLFDDRRRPEPLKRWWPKCVASSVRIRES